MTVNERVVTLETINGGAVLDLFTEEFEKLIDNVADGNTEPDKVRSITIKVSVKPSKNREMAATKVEVTSRLAPLKPNEATIVFSSDGTKVEAFTTAQGKQQALPGMDQNVRPFPAAAGEGK